VVLNPRLKAVPPDPGVIVLALAPNPPIPIMKPRFTIVMVSPEVPPLSVKPGVAASFE
jgi:hypothetical protein